VNYSKPEVAVLGKAIVVIENLTSKPGSSNDGQSSAPAYDLDE